MAAVQLPLAPLAGALQVPEALVARKLPLNCSFELAVMLVLPWLETVPNNVKLRAADDRHAPPKLPRASTSIQGQPPVSLPV